MKRRPHQNYYRPGSGTLRKSNSGADENKSNSNFVSPNELNHSTHVESKFKSESIDNSLINHQFAMEHTIQTLDNMSIKDNMPRRNKKPDKEIYVPRMVAQNKKPDQISYNRDDQSREEPFIGDNERNFHGSNGRRYETYNNEPNKSKRHSNKRRDNRDNRDWDDQKNQRQMRQGSEPRGTNSNRDSYNWQRTRDTRSVEPFGPPPQNNFNEKSYTNKPPSGRRHSTTGLERMNELPPRFRKKMLEEGKLKNLNFPEESWDGSSLTFQGSAAPQNFTSIDNYNSGLSSYSTLPNSHITHNSHIGNFSTLPNRSRGRGRFSQDQYDLNINTGRLDMKSPCNSRPPTPPSYNNCSYENGNYGRPTSRPHTPSSFNNRKNDYNRNNEDKYQHSGSRHSSQERYRKNHNSNNRRSEERFTHRRNDSERSNYRNRNDYQRESKKEIQREDLHRDVPKTKNNPPKVEKQETEDQLSSISSVEVAESRISIPNTGNFDWSEEVELNFKLEAEAALSDALSSSVTSLAGNNTISGPSKSDETRNSRKSKGRTKKKGRRRGRSPNELRDQSSNRSNNDNFQIPAEPFRHRKQSKDRRDSSYERYGRSSHSRDCSFDRIRRTSTSANEHENWRDEIKTRQEKEGGNRRESEENRRSRQNSEDAKSIADCTLDIRKPGILVIQQQKTQENATGTLPPSLDHPRYAEARKHTSMCARTKSLFDPKNPNIPIIVKNSNARSAPGIPENKELTPQTPAYLDQYGNVCPEWYREDSEEHTMSHYPNMIKDVRRADQEIQYAIHSGIFLQNWSTVERFRSFLKEALQYFLCKDLKFSQTGNIEQHFWKLLYYNIIERIRKAIQEDETNKEHYKKFALYLVDEGTQYFEKLLKMLEDTYQFQLSDYLGVGHSMPPKGLGYVGLALVSAHKIFIFLGDLARYKEQINETTNYGKCRQWYIKAHELNPKNGRPYKQLAFLAVCARRKLDAVYYYMRSLMASNPVQTSKHKLTTLFHENSKKYEQGEKKRREERLERARQHMKEKENERSNNFPTSIRRETWIRPDGGKRVHRTTQAVQENEDSDEENLAALSSVEVNKRFVISYLHVHGKLITRIEMDSFQEAAMQMLKEFRALLQHSPLPLQSTRLLQLLALNMYAIESTQLKDPELQQNAGYRSEFQERALIVSLQMFNLILERCVSILEEHFASKPEQINVVCMDAHVLLPSIKIWCDWMLCHSSIWNPPPSIQEYKVGAPGDTWTRLASLINLLGQFDQTASSVFETKQTEDYDQLRLPEDNVLSGFTPLMLNVDEPTYVPKNYVDEESAQFVLRVKKLLFFGTEFLCGLEPPVLKLEIYNDSQEYISVVSTSNSRDSPQSVEEMSMNNEVLIESFSDDEQEVISDNLSEDTSSEVRDLLNRKIELERKHKNHELHMERVKKILSQSVIRVHIDIQPKYLVPDTNCFIDYLDKIMKIINTTSSPYTVMVPIVVLGELEGLSRGGKSPIPKTNRTNNNDPEHTKKVAESARQALGFLRNRHTNLKCVTTKGAVFNSTTFTTEDDTSNCLKNDDKILTTCLNLSKVHGKEQSNTEGEPKQLFREVVLLTDDRNLRVKALSTDVPVRELPDFMKWAGLG